MDSFILLIRNGFTFCDSLLKSIQFDIGGFTVSYMGIMLGALVVSIIASVFWKGGKG